MLLKSTVLLTVALLTGCASLSNPNHVGIDWGTGDCPVPPPELISATNHLMMVRGKTQKCQVRPYVSNMACQGIADGDDDAVVCQNAAGQQSVFVFDASGTLIEYRRLK